MTVELYALNAAVKNSKGDNDDLTPVQVAATTVLLIIIMVLWVLAIIRALKCSKKTPDSRALHLLFASTSPVLYLIFSYFVSGFCGGQGVV